MRAAAQAAHDAEEAPQYERLRAALATAPNLRSHVAAALESVATAMTSARATITGPVGTVANMPSMAVPAIGGAGAASAKQSAVPLSVPGMVSEQ